MTRNLLFLTAASVLASMTAASAADYATEPTEMGLVVGAEQEVVAVEEDDSLIDVNIDLGLFDDDEEEELALADAERPEPPLISK